MPASPTHGPTHALIVTAILGGCRTTDAVAVACKRTMSGDALIRTLMRMESRGWIARHRRGWCVTDAGRRLLPRVFVDFSQQGTYHAPPAAPRRADSDMTVYPSVYAGVEQAYRRHL